VDFFEGVLILRFLVILFAKIEKNKIKNFMISALS